MSWPSCTLLLAVGVGAAIAFPAELRAERLGFLEIAARGVPEAAVPKFGDAVQRGLEGADFEVISNDDFTALLEESSWVEGCTFGPCMRRVHESTGVERALVVRVQGIGSSYTFVASIVDTRTGALLAQAQQQCAACSINDAEAAASLLGPDLMLAMNSGAQAGAPLPGPEAGALAAKGDRLSGLRTTSYLFMGAALGLAGAGAYFLSEDDDDLGLPLVAGGGAALVGGITMFVFSRDF